LISRKRLSAYQRDEIVQQMRLTGHHASHGLVVDVNDVDVEVVYKSALSLW
jgi:hypothetical protein